MGRGDGRHAGALRPGKLGSLAALLERHGGAIRADLRRYYSGLSLTDMFEGRVSPDEVWDCVIRLPRESATMAALFDDPDFEPGDEVRELRLTEYSPEVEATKDVRDAVVSLIAVVSSLLSKQPVKLEPSRRPGEARRKRLAAERSAQARREWDALCDQMGVRH